MGNDIGHGRGRPDGHTLAAAFDGAQRGIGDPDQRVERWISLVDAAHQQGAAAENPGRVSGCKRPRGFVHRRKSLNR